MTETEIPDPIPLEDPTTSIFEQSSEIESTKPIELKSDPEKPAASQDYQNQDKCEPSSNQGSSRDGVAIGQQAPSLSIEQQLQKAKRDLESMVLNYARSERENLKNINKVEELDKRLKRSIKDNEQLANRIKLLTNDKNHLTDTLNAKVAQLTVLEQKNSFLIGVQGTKLKDSEERLKQLESLNEELIKQLESYKSKEVELTDFSKKLSMKHMLLQSDLEEALKRVPDYKEQHDLAIRERDNAIRQSEELSERIDSLTESLRREQAISESLRNDIVEVESKYNRELDELHNEIKVMRRKQQMAAKELVKEIKHLQAQLDESAASKGHNNFVSSAS